MSEVLNDPILEGCRKDNPQVPSTDIINANSYAMGKMLEMAGAESCKSASGVIVAPLLLAAGGATYSQGCEQLAAIATSLDASQRVFNCAIQEFSTKATTNVVGEYIINVSIEGFTGTNCTINVEQKTAVNVGVYNTFTTSVKAAMTSQLQNTMESFLQQMQDDKQSGLFTTPSGQKALTQFQARIEQLVSNDAYTEVITEVFNKFVNKNVIDFKLGPGSSIIFQENRVGQNCINVTQANVLQIISQNIVDNAVDLTFNTDLENTLKTILTQSNKRETTGFQIPDFGIILIGIVLVIALVLMFAKKPGGEGGQPQPILSGKAAKGFGIFLLVAGLATAIAGVVLIIQKQNAFLSYGLLIGGVLLSIAGLMMFLKAKSQDAVFEHEVEVAKARAGPAPTIVQTPASAPVQYPPMQQYPPTQYAPPPTQYPQMQYPPPMQYPPS